MTLNSKKNVREKMENVPVSCVAVQCSLPSKFIYYFIMLATQNMLKLP